MFGFLKSLFSRGKEEAPPRPARFALEDVARRLGLGVAQLRSVDIQYQTFQTPKRSGGSRKILAPAAKLKNVQRLILRRVLRGLRAHPNATGFERGHSIVTNALCHAGKDVVIRLDLVDFFPSTTAKRVHRYFRFIGYDEETAALLTDLCTYDGALPQGAPTSPRLSNLVNYRLDARLGALAATYGMWYSRYADDITFSAQETNHAVMPQGKAGRSGSKATHRLRSNPIIHAAKMIIKDEGYRIHQHRKLRIYRRHDRQMVTGLVVNERPNLPRETRRRLRAIAHHLRTGRPATLTAEQLAGWDALRSMIELQRDGVPPID